MSKVLNDRVYSILKRYWNFHSFRKNQEEIIEAILLKKDIVALIPTGGGKSLCFQLPAMVMEGCCLVVTPLIALMNDQVDRLKDLSIAAEALHSGLDRYSSDLILNKFVNNKLKLLYVSPEKLQSKYFSNQLHKAKISFFAVDEAHCISQWGYDFRPDYRKIKEVKKLFPGISIAAFTATANKKTLKDIKTYLDLRDEKVFRGSFLKGNIRFGTIKTEKKLKTLELLLKEFQGSGIIYMRSRKGTEKLSFILNDLGFNTDFYHAGMSNDTRSAIQNKWLKNETGIIISTTAFGMGIDKPDVRFVIHYDLPTSMEEYYQEAGRAGRDGKMSDSVIIYNDKNLTRLKANHVDTFPTLEFISNIYNSLKDYYKIREIPDNGLVFSFDLDKFQSFADYSKQKIYKAITELERYGFIELNHPVRDSFSKMKILDGSEVVLDPIQLGKDTVKIIKAAIFLYEDLFSVNSNISELKIAKEAGLNKNLVINKLRELHEKGLISYQRRFTEIKILFKSAHNKEIEPEELAFRKNRLVHNINSIEKYLKYTKCRQKFILDYFDEKLKKHCGICDICLKSDLAKFSNSDFYSFKEKISNFDFGEKTGIDDLAFIDTYMNRNKNLQMIRKLIEDGELKLAGDKIKKANGQ